MLIDVISKAYLRQHAPVKAIRLVCDDSLPSYHDLSDFDFLVGAC